MRRYLFVSSLCVVFCIFLTACIPFEMLDEKQEWREMTLQKAEISIRNQFVQLEGLVIKEGKELVTTRSDKIHEIIRFTMPGSLAPIDWLVFLTNEYNKKQSGMSRDIIYYDMVKVSDYHYRRDKFNNGGNIIQLVYLTEEMVFEFDYLCINCS